MTNVRKVALLMGAGLLLFGATAALTSVMLSAYPSLLSSLKIFSKPDPKLVCKTITTDPNPPLNVRSSPVSAPDNIVGRLRNGTQLKVVDENEGWLRVVSPIEGWVYKDLTVTTCVPETVVQAVTKSPDTGEVVLRDAIEFYQAGNLKAAIALAQTIPASSSAYYAAQGAINQWQQDWKTAEADYYAAQKAFREGRWQDVLNRVRNFPSNRYWRARLTPMVQEAIKRQQQGSSK
ncbi:SH3 domain-containing protein [Leptothermofonsia sp. ETS-13]|uniref:SH3 domain-containing protein n=1 Tax=Leptothermofonsia sp. ETS-13 TaxID=3035696 RepID=UPI003B9FCD24